MKNKLIKFLSTGICCIMISILVSASIPQKDPVALTSNSIQKISVILLGEDPPFY